jgi:hypothetical protein
VCVVIFGLYKNKICINCFAANEYSHTISKKLNNTGDSKNSDTLSNCGIATVQGNYFGNYSSYEVSQSNYADQSAS